MIFFDKSSKINFRQRCSHPFKKNRNAPKLNYLLQNFPYADLFDALLEESRPN